MKNTCSADEFTSALIEPNGNYNLVDVKFSVGYGENDDFSSFQKAIIDAEAQMRSGLGKEISPTEVDKRLAQDLAEIE